MFPYLNKRHPSNTVTVKRRAYSSAAVHAHGTSELQGSMATVPK